MKMKFVVLFDVERYAHPAEKAKHSGAKTSVVVRIVVGPDADGKPVIRVEKFELARARNPVEANKVLDELAAAFPETPSACTVHVCAGGPSLDMVGVLLPVKRRQIGMEGAYESITGTDLQAKMNAFVNASKVVNLLRSPDIKFAKKFIGEHHYGGNSLAALLASFGLGEKLESDGSQAVRLVDEGKFDELLEYCYVDTVALIFVLQYMHKKIPDFLIESWKEDAELSKFADVDEETLRVMLEKPVPLMDWVTGRAREFHLAFYANMDQFDTNFKMMREEFDAKWEKNKTKWEKNKKSVA